MTAASVIWSNNQIAKCLYRYGKYTIQSQSGKREKKAVKEEMVFWQCPPLLLKSKEPIPLCKWQSTNKLIAKI